MKKPAIFFLGGLAYVVGVGAVYKYMKDKRVEEEFRSVPTPTSNEQITAIYDKIAPDYDKAVASDEKYAGIDALRKKLMANASGKVLELAAGSGRNWAYYPSDVSVVAIDYSEKMIERARTKGLPPNLLELRRMDAHKLDFPSETFDTVVETFALCSYENPVKVLNEMQRVCKPDGKVLLFEHGKSSWKLVNYFMDRSSEKHAKRWGCWFNRDIEAIIAASGLHVLEAKRHNFGTLYYVIAQPKQYKST